jgi:hypothetical protein
LVGVVRSVDSTIDTLSPKMVRTAGGFGPEGYHRGDGRYGGVNQQQDRGSSRQENRMVWNPKSDGPVSLKRT